ncbi:hypothetical protein [Ahniella affigens]|uniref:hypothetical protein n=1 Tax=Ahniella affigens TaxID=2021234 RepID=UPI0014767EE1|nr:hypothetical protein [Ahniella affigens]
MSLLPGPHRPNRPGDRLPLYHFGDYLKLRADGACVTQILALYDQTGDSVANNVVQTNLGLVFNGVRMKQMATTLTRHDEGKSLELAFLLSRDSENIDNRQAWNDFLGTARHHEDRHSELLVELGLIIGKDPVRHIGAAQAISFLGSGVTSIYIAIALGFIAMVLAFFFALKHPSLLRVHPNGAYSLAKSQMAFWAVLLAVTFAVLYGLLDDMEHIPNSLLILVGLSGATSFASVWITPSADKMAMADHTMRHFLQDICSDGTGASVHRVQAVIWTGMLGVVFINQVMLVISMPDFNNTLLTLLGISNGTYVAMKMKE